MKRLLMLPAALLLSSSLAAQSTGTSRQLAAASNGTATGVATGFVAVGVGLAILGLYVRRRHNKRR